MTQLARRQPVCTKTMDRLVLEIYYWFIFIFQGPFYWFLQEKDSLFGENRTKLAWTNNITRAPSLICLGRGLTQDEFEKPNFVTNWFLSFVVDCRIREGWCFFVELYNLLFFVNIIWSSRNHNMQKSHQDPVKILTTTKIPPSLERRFSECVCSCLGIKPMISWSLQILTW